MLAEASAPSSSRSRQLVGGLLSRVRIALVLVAVLAISSFCAEMLTLHAQESDAPTINVSGRQRMLSQRLSLMALRYSAATAPAERERIGRLLDQAIEEMTQAHEALTGGDAELGIRSPASHAIRRRYFGPGDVDRRVRAYLADARKVRDLPEGTLRPDSPLIVSLLDRSEHELLRDLHALVETYEAIGTERVEWLKAGQLLLLLCTLGLLSIEYLAIYRPVARHIGAQTEQLELEIVERRAAEDQAAEASRSQSRFLAKMSHELRTPLNAVIGYTELLRDEVDEETHQTDLAKIHGAARHLLGMINDLLDLERAEFEGWRFSLEPVAINVVLANVVDTLQPLNAKHGNRVIVEVPSELPLGCSDRRRLVQVLVNVMGNASKFTRHGTVRVVSRVTSEGELELQVRDTGPGLSDRDALRIFEPFAQLDDSGIRTHKGTGLGLAIAREIVIGLGGRIWAKGDPGRGSTFTITLPWSPVPPLTREVVDRIR